MISYDSENRIVFRPFDEDLFEWLIDTEIKVPWECGTGCGKRCARMVKDCHGNEFEALDADYLMIVDRTHYRPICHECFKTFGKPRSTAEGIFGL